MIALLLQLLSFQLCRSSSTSSIDIASNITAEQQVAPAFCTGSDCFDGINLTTSGLVGYASNIDQIFPGATSVSPTVSTTVSTSSASTTIDSSMTLAQCLGNLTETLPYYQSFASSVNNISVALNVSHSRLSNIQMITHSLLNEETLFTKELSDLQGFYNQLAARANSLASWMTQERQIRDQLAVFYNGMVTLHAQEREKLETMNTALASALAVMKDVQRRTDPVIQGVADAALVTYPWALNVTTSCDTHTLRLDALASSMTYRLRQLEASKAETIKMARVAAALATSYQNASLIDEATGILQRLNQ